ncbi:phasin family protein [Acidimangrovimonas pyrenivorans]|uniref:Phasin family protein n=1 Tax=Acidimangrovimonas pyrenivorans TaxID=2030798 RepID=A0ABV7AG54_9RHOB
MAPRKSTASPDIWKFTSAIPDARDGMAAFLRPQAKMVEAMLAQNVEMLDFMKDRFEKDRAMMAELAEAEDPSALMGLWSDFWQRMMADYSTESGKLASSMSSIAGQALKSVSEEGKAMTDTLSASGRK